MHILINKILDDNMINQKLYNHSRLCKENTTIICNGWGLEMFEGDLL